MFRYTIKEPLRLNLEFIFMDEIIEEKRGEKSLIIIKTLEKILQPENDEDIKFIGRIVEIDGETKMQVSISTNSITDLKKRILTI